MEQFDTFLKNEDIAYETNVELREKTWIHRGGKADYFVSPKNSVALEKIMTYLYDSHITHLLVGSTSNLYILNTTNIPVVVSTLRCNTYEIKEETIECECGVQVSKLAEQVIKLGIKGFEYLTKLPGTVGAAIYNNSSCKSNSISELLIDVDMVTPQGIKKVSAEELHFAFRTSDLKRSILRGVILKARLRLAFGQKDELERKAKDNEIERRKLLEGPAQNLGCTVHKPFSNGSMPFRYRVPSSIYSKIITLLVKDELKRKRLNKSFLLTISGHKKLIPYVSDYLSLIFVWRDDNADEFFNEYLSFMKDIYKTDKVEIEIIK